MITKEKLILYKNSICDFAQEQFIIPETAKPIVLEKWQIEEILNPLFSTKENDKRKYSLALVSMPKRMGSLPWQLLL